MIFNTVVFYLAFLIPAAVVFRCTSGPARAWSSVAFGVAFFTYYSATQFGSWWGVACVLLFVWEETFRSFYRPGGWACLAGVAVSVGVLVAFKYWNFLTGLAFAADNPVRWEGVFLPLGVSFFTFEFIHYAVAGHGSTEDRVSIWRARPSAVVSY